MGYLYTPSYTPRHLRRRSNNRKNGPGQEEKSKMFHVIAVRSKRFINQKASQLTKEGPLHREYELWAAKSAAGRGFR